MLRCHTKIFPQMLGKEFCNCAPGGMFDHELLARIVRFAPILDKCSRILQILSTHWFFSFAPLRKALNESCEMGPTPFLTRLGCRTRFAPCDMPAPFESLPAHKLKDPRRGLLVCAPSWSCFDTFVSRRGKRKAVPQMAFPCR
jgi:hypothetical protein